MSNPFVCKCGMKWLKNWLKKINIATGNPKCNTPIWLKDHSLTSLSDDEFSCENQLLDECTLNEQEISLNKTIIYECPVECICSNSIVRCSHSNLKHIPQNIPLNTKEL